MRAIPCPYACHFALTPCRISSVPHPLARKPYPRRPPPRAGPDGNAPRREHPARCGPRSGAAVPVELGYLLLEESACLSGVSSFGLEMSASNRLSTLGLIGPTPARSPRYATHALLSLIKSHNEALLLPPEETGAHAMLSIEYPVDPTLTGQAIEQGVAMMLRTLRVPIRRDWQPSRVCSRTRRRRRSPSIGRCWGASAVQRGIQWRGAGRRGPDRPVQTADPALAHWPGASSTACWKNAVPPHRGPGARTRGAASGPLHHRTGGPAPGRHRRTHCTGTWNVKASVPATWLQQVRKDQA